jgi:hypothetical protein
MDCDMTGLGLWMAVLIGGFAANNTTDSAQLLAGEDLHLRATRMWACRQTQTPDEHVLLFENGFSMSIGDNRLSGQNAVVWLKAWGQSQPGFGSQTYYQAQVYLENDVNFRQGKRAKTTSLEQVIVQDGHNLVVRFLVTGEVFATADEQKELVCEELQKQDLYQRASAEAAKIHEGPMIAQSALVPELPKTAVAAAGQAESLPVVVGAVQAAASDVVTEPAGQSKQKEPVFTYPVHVSAVWDPEPVIERTPSAEGGDAVTVSGRFYLWQRQSADSLLEFQADSAVLFFQSGQFETTRQQGGRDLAQGRIESAYLRGNIVMTEGKRTIRADEIYYDFLKKQAVVVNASMRMFDEKRGLPIYLSAERLRRVGDSLFQAQKVTLTSSEFYLPQLSATASRMVMMKEETAEQRADAAQQASEARQAQPRGKSDEASKYVGTMYDVNMKYYKQKIFGWPKINSRFVRPEIPLSKIAFGNDSEYGTSLETRWYLFRLLGWKEPAGMDTRLAADYFSKRGVGGGVDTEYEFENSFGNMIGYIMTDRGKDDLGSADSRRNLDSGQDLRGRFGLRHREFLPDDWQATVEVGYVSDRNFLEWMYRDEFYTDKGQETLIHLKQQRDNWALSILGKTRINDFESMTEEMPTVEYHRTGQSFWDNRLTWYSDSRVSRLRDRYDEELTGHPAEKFYTFGSTRNEVDMPFMLSTVKVTPFVAGTYAYEDQNGYDLSLSGRNTGMNDTALLGETGLRASTQFWKEDPSVRSRLWDIDGIRHILMPHVEMVTYGQTEAGIEQRNVVNAGLSQRWQTHRGQGEDRRIVDWLRLDVDSTWLDRAAESAIGPAALTDPSSGDFNLYGPLASSGAGSTYGPSKFIFNDSSIPVFLRRNDRYFGMVRNSVNTDMEWRVTDTTALLGDMNYDVQSGVVQQLDVGMSRYVYPDLSLYLGSRYLRPIIIDVDENDDGIAEVHEEGSQSVIGAVTYQLGQRYWVTFSQEYNFDFGKSISSNFALIRQYHRLFYSLEVSVDQSLNRNGVMFSVWPQGVKELSLGSRRYTGLIGARTEQ